MTVNPRFSTKNSIETLSPVTDEALSLLPEFTSLRLEAMGITYYAILWNEILLHGNFSGNMHDRACAILRDSYGPVTSAGTQAHNQFHDAFMELLEGKIKIFSVIVGSYFLGRGTVFQQKVWTLLRTIPFGTTKTYSEIATLLGMPAASRAVGGACGANPLALAIPCHRVVGVKTLGGFSGGKKIKEKLLSMEASEHGHNFMTYLGKGSNL